MKRFIEKISSMGFNLKNDKGRALYEYVVSKYSNVLLNDDDALAEMVSDIDNKSSELDKEYPRLKQSLVLNEYTSPLMTGVTLYYVRWKDKNSSAAFTIHLMNVVGEMTGENLIKEDKACVK